VDTTAVLKFGETLILSGLTEDENEKDRDGVPLLQNIPGVQYFFSRDERSETKKSILILLTPRKARYLDDDMTTEELKEVSRQLVEPDKTYISELKKKERITSNIDAVLYRFSRKSSFYRQFRRGDLDISTWNNEDTVWGAIKRVMGFIYY
jgi:type II secretory pathway component GspD/PulD (secretin)